MRKVLNMKKKYEVSDKWEYRTAVVQALTAIANELAELNKNTTRLKGE